MVCGVVALAVKLACACQLKPGLEVFGYRALQQGVLGVARVVEFGFGARVAHPHPHANARAFALKVRCGHGAAHGWAWLAA